MKTFTVYPSFASPYKRYVLEDIEKISKKYLEDEQQTYDTAVNNKGSSIGYEEEGNKNVDHFLAPSTLWRWIRWLKTTKTLENNGTISENVNFNKALYLVDCCNKFQ